MLKLLIYLLTLIAFISIVASPWLTAVAYFANGIMQPKYIWPFTFPTFAISKTLAIFAILALFASIATKKIDSTIYRHTQNYVLLAMWGLIHLSELLSPYPVYFAGVKADTILSTLNTIIIMYFVGLGLLSHIEQYKKSMLGMAIMFTLIAVYYSYWANSMYFGNRWDMFANGRLNSPRGTSIGDQNGLSCLMVMGMPFILLGFFYIKNKILKWACIGVLPLLWHSLFLFGSRGAMIAVLIATLVILKLLSNPSNSNGLSIKFKYVKTFKMFIAIGFISALIMQGGAMMQRSSETASQARQGGDAPLNPRLVSWKVGQKLITNFPLLGAGPQRFQMASHKLFPGESVHVAHNTFLNFSANTGLPVGLLFLFLFWLSYKNYKYCTANSIDEYPILDYLNKACAVSLLAFFVSAIFLDLIVFEAFYFILMLNLAKLHLFKKLKSNTNDNNDDNLRINKPDKNIKKYRNADGILVSEK